MIARVNKWWVWFALNAGGIAMFFALAVKTWIEPDLANVPGPSGGAFFVWGITALPLFVLFVAANLVLGIKASRHCANSLLADSGTEPSSSRWHWSPGLRRSISTASITAFDVSDPSNSNGRKGSKADGSYGWKADISKVFGVYGPHMTYDRTSSSRNTVFVIGAVLMVAAVPLAFLAVIYGSGGEMLAFVQSRTERMWIAALVAFPVLMFAAGASLLWASRGGRYGLAVAIALLMCVDIVAFAALTWIQNQPEPRVIVAPPDPHTVIGPTGGTVR